MAEKRIYTDIDAKSNLSIGGDAAAATYPSRLHITGSGNTVSTLNALLENLAGDDLLKIYDDGTSVIGTGGATGSSALFEIQSVTQGFLKPRMTTTQRNAISPAAGDFGLEVYDTDLDNTYFWNGSAWVRIDSNLYNIDDTVGAGRIATLTDTLTFTGGEITIKGSGNTSGTNSLLIKNSADSNLLTVRDDIRVGINKSAPDAHLNIKGTDVLNATKTFVTEGSGGLVGMQITNSGRVGIQVPIGNVPAALLEVRGGVINVSTLLVTENTVGANPVAGRFLNNRDNGKALFVSTDETAGRTGSFAIDATSRGTGIPIQTRTTPGPSTTVEHLRMNASSSSAVAQVGGFFTGYVRNDTGAGSEEVMRQTFAYTDDTDGAEYGSWTLGLIDNGTTNTEKIYVESAFSRISNSLGIGSSTTPVASSILQIDSTTKGFLKPRMTTTQRNAIATPATGLEVYDTDLDQTCYWNGSSWDCIDPSGGGASLTKYSASHLAVAATSFTVTHGITGLTNGKEIIINCVDDATGEAIEPDTIDSYTTTSVDLTFATAGDYTVTIIG